MRLLTLRMQVAVAALLGLPLFQNTSALPSAPTSAQSLIATSQIPSAVPTSILDLGYIIQNSSIASNFDLLRRREDKFTLWIPGQPPGVVDAPKLILGTIDNSTSPATLSSYLVALSLNPTRKTSLNWILIPSSPLFRVTPSIGTGLRL